MYYNFIINITIKMSTKLKKNANAPIYLINHVNKLRHRKVTN